MNITREIKEKYTVDVPFGAVVMEKFDGCVSLTRLVLVRDEDGIEMHFEGYAMNKRGEQDKRSPHRVRMHSGYNLKRATSDDGEFLAGLYKTYNDYILERNFAVQNDKMPWSFEEVTAEIWRLVAEKA